MRGKGKPKSRRTVAEWEMEIERVKQQSWLYEVALHDVVVTDGNRMPHPNRARVGSAVTVHVQPGEDKGAEEYSVSAAMYRPEGSCPTVILHWRRGVGSDLQQLVEVVGEDEFLRIDKDNENFLPLLRDRMRRAVAEYRGVKKEVVG